LTGVNSFMSPFPYCGAHSDVVTAQHQCCRDTTQARSLIAGQRTPPADGKSTIAYVDCSSRMKPA
jgi:hypothetical protein